MKIRIVLPYPDADTQAGLWAISEEEIDFRREPEKGARCTAAFAATELRDHLLRCLSDAEVTIGSAPEPGAFTVFLELRSPEDPSETYELIPEEGTLRIRGEGRTGVLYGVYELLKLQGWRWYEPGDAGETVPPVRDALILPETPRRYGTSFPVCRGFNMEGALKESADFCLWMARNRLDQSGCRPHTKQLMRKLGIAMRHGGHIFEGILDPDRLMPSGKTVWEEHPEWYGTPETGEKTRERALLTQFCVSRPDLLDFLSEELLSHVMGEWYDADQIDVWSFDTWGSVCRCEACRRLGNGTDQNLYLASHLRDYLNAARRDGRLDHDVKMVLCAYEGTSSLLAPEKPVPQNLIDAGDYALYATIVRCYDHDFGDPACSYNRVYDDALKNWEKVRPCIPVAALEYYNVSKFEDLPLLFTEGMRKDIPYFAAHGATGMCYMHIPIVNWGMRALTQTLYAELSWDPTCDVNAVLDDYYRGRYGEYAPQMRRIYGKIEAASRDIISWRAWKDRSVLTQMLDWDGARPAAPLRVDDHLETPEGMERRGERNVRFLSEALEELEEVLRLQKRSEAGSSGRFGSALNPIEARKQGEDLLRRALTEDRRLLIYGLDTARLALALGKYYNALFRRDDPAGDALWAEIESLETRLEGYYLPITHDGGYLGIISKDALARTQMGKTIDRCRVWRLRNGMPVA